MKVILIIDAVINFILGVLLLVFTPSVVSILGVPASSTRFYPNILGAIFIGITIALLIGATGNEARRSGGLGFAGAVSINLCGGTVLALWLIFGRLHLQTRGLVFLWALVGVLIVVSLVELLRFGRPQR